MFRYRERLRAGEDRGAL
ncbi:MAG TPA: hypothetical protein VF106_25685 [Actinophytocola sp.]